MKKIKNKRIYESPQVIELEDQKFGKGDCAAGSNDATGSCLPGGTAVGQCGLNGNSAGEQCYAGGTGA